MTVWEVIGGILTLCTLVGVFLKPILMLNTNIIKLTDAVENLQKATASNAKCLDDMSHTIGEHEVRITVLEECIKGV